MTKSIRNLLNETVSCLKEHRKTPDSVRFVMGGMVETSPWRTGITTVWMTWDEFAAPSRRAISAWLMSRASNCDSSHAPKGDVRPIRLSFLHTYCTRPVNSC